MTKPQLRLKELFISGVPSWTWPIPKVFEGPFHFLSVCHRGTLSAACKPIVMPLCLQPAVTFLGLVLKPSLGVDNEIIYVML